MLGRHRKHGLVQQSVLSPGVARKQKENHRWRVKRFTCWQNSYFSPSVAPDISSPPLLDEAAAAKFGHGYLFSFSSCKIEYKDLGQELVTRAMDRMKVLGMGRLCF
jgi:hypothetical protein